MKDKKIKRMKDIFNEFNIKQLCINKADEYTQAAIACLNKITANENKKNELKQLALALLKRET